MGGTRKKEGQKVGKGPVGHSVQGTVRGVGAGAGPKPTPRQRGDGRRVGRVQVRTIGS